MCKAAHSQPLTQFLSARFKLVPDSSYCSSHHFAEQQSYSRIIFLEQYCRIIYGADIRVLGVRFPALARYVSVFAKPSDRYWAHAVSYSMATVVCSPQNKVSGA